MAGRHYFLRVVALAASLILVIGCGNVGAFVWVEDAPAAAVRPIPETLILPGDTVSVRVFGQDTVSVRSPVRSDGMLAVPLLGDVPVAGKSGGVVAKEIEARLQPFINAPHVIVVVEESHTRVVVIGEVRRPGTVLLEGSSGVLTALANAGGLTEFASDDKIFVLRTDNSGSFRLRFRYEDLAQGIGRAGTFKLRTGDQIVVD